MCMPCPLSQPWGLKLRAGMRLPGVRHFLRGAIESMARDQPHGSLPVVASCGASASEHTAHAGSKYRVYTAASVTVRPCIRRRIIGCGRGFSGVHEFEYLSAKEPSAARTRALGPCMQSKTLGFASGAQMAASVSVKAINLGHTSLKLCRSASYLASATPRAPLSTRSAAETQPHACARRWNRWLQCSIARCPEDTSCTSLFAMAPE